MKRVYPFLFVALLFAGCDSGGSAGDGDPFAVVVDGRVEDEDGYGKTAIDVSGAIVTAASIDAQGRQVSHVGTATVDASGRYRLEIEGALDYVLLTAQKDSFEASVILKKSASASSATAAPMNQESSAEAEVFVASRLNAEMRDLSYAQIAAYVNAVVADEIEAGDVTAASVATTIFRGRQAEDEYVDEEYSEADEKPMKRREEEEQAIIQLQSALHSASSASAEMGALAAFDDALVRAMADAGISAEASARARQSGRSAVIEYGAGLSADAAFELRSKAELYAAVAMSASVEAAFAADAAASSVINAVEAAGMQLESDIASASSNTEIEAAFSAYGVAVDAQLAAHLEVTPTVVEGARGATAAARAVLDVAISTSLTVQAMVSAQMEFYTAAEAAVAASLSGSASADMAASIIATLEAR